MNTKTIPLPDFTAEEEAAFDFGDLPKYDDSFEEDDELFFYGLQITGTKPSELKNPKSAKAYAAWLKDNGHSIA